MKRIRKWGCPRCRGTGLVEMSTYRGWAGAALEWIICQACHGETMKKKEGKG
jgi:hypothetical protein